jgi:hypothetical protein
MLATYMQQSGGTGNGPADRVRIGAVRTREETAMPKGLLFASFDYSGAHEDEFHDWYDLEHIPERLRVPGFINAERWIGDENPKIAVATYDLDNTGDRRRQCFGVDQARHRDVPSPDAL